MDKKELMNHINQQHKAGLRVSNTAYSKINKSKKVWWFNVSVHKFTEDVHLLLNDKDQALWIVLPKGFAKGVPFRIREDKNAVDLEISSNKTFMYLKDVKSGGSNFSFKPYLKETIKY